MIMSIIEKVSKMDKKEKVKYGVRGIGSDYCPCYITGENSDRKHIVNNLSGFVKSKEDGEKIVRMFDGLAFLDYRENEPDWIQVKVGASKKYFTNLEYLEILIKEDGFITKEKIEKSKTYKPIIEETEK